MTSGLGARGFFVLLFAVFVVALAYGVLLPLLPSLLERQLGSAAAVSWHTGALSGVYMLALLLFAPAWGLVSDRWERRGVILVGLSGFAVAMTLFAFIDHLPALYAGRFLSGAFSSAVLPVAQALVADFSPDEGWRAKRFAWLNISGIAGFLVGPILGGALGNMWRTQMPASGAPFLFIAAAAGIAVLLAACMLPPHSKDRPTERYRVGAARPRDLRLLLLSSALLSLGLGTFEVGLTLVGKQELGLSPGRLGMMFAECMAAMVIAQVLVFNPWFPPRATRWLLSPAFVLLAVALFLLPLARNAEQLFWVVAAIAGAAGVLTPVLGLWVSMTAGDAQGSELGWQTASSSAGQAVGSAMAGLLYGTFWLTGSAFLLAAGGAFAGGVVSVMLSFRLGGSGSSSAIARISSNP